MAGHLLTASGRSLNNFNGVTPNPPTEEGRPARVALLQYLLRTDQRLWSRPTSVTDDDAKCVSEFRTIPAFVRLVRNCKPLIELG